MAAASESGAAVALIASLIRQMYIKKMLGEADIAAIFGHADDAIPGKHNRKLDSLWIRAQEIIAE